MGLSYHELVATARVIARAARLSSQDEPTRTAAEIRERDAAVRNSRRVARRAVSILYAELANAAARARLAREADGGLALAHLYRLAGLTE